MQHMVNKARTHWVAANLISGHLAQAGKHRHGTAPHSQGRCSAPKAVVWAKPMAFDQGAVFTGGVPVLSCDARLGNCDNSSHTPTQTCLQKSAHRPWEVRRPGRLENS